MSQDWRPPFAKKRETQSFTVKEGETFEQVKDGAPLFAIQAIQGDKVLLEYNRMYTLKGYEHPTERCIWLNSHTPIKFSSLWEDNGITKTVTLRSVKYAEGETPPAPVEASANGNESTEDTEIYRPNQ